jgi:peptidyl-prolyl cis-trans isomerase SurA
MFRIFSVFIIILFHCAAFSQNLIDKVVATVGSEPILLSDIEQQYAYLIESKKAVNPSAKCGILENMIIQNLLLNQSKIDSLVAKEEEVDAEVNTRIEEILRYMGNDETQFQEYYNKTVPEVKNQMREPMQQQILIRKMRQEIMSKITITPKEVKDYFNNIPKDSLPYLSSEVELAEIIYQPKVSSAQKKIAFDKITDIRSRITMGKEDFAKLAEKYSQDLGSARTGGDLGLVKRGTFVPEFEAAAYNLEKDEVSPVIETEFGFHIIKLIERKGNNIRCRHILIKPEITPEDLERAKHELDSIRTMIVRDSLSFSHAVKKFSNKKEYSYDNDGLIANPRSGNTSFEIRELEPDIYFMQDKMKVGEVSAPFEKKDQSGEVSYMIIKLLSRSTPHKANLVQDYKKIAEVALEQKKSAYLIEWLVAHADQTRIEIVSDFDSCDLLQKWKAVAKN